MPTLLRLEGATTTKEAIIAAIVGAVFGGAGFTGLVFAYLRRFIDSRLNAKEQEDAKRHALQIRRRKNHDAWQHAAGRLFYHIHKYIETGHHNGDLEAAWAEFQRVEKEKKDLDLEVLAETEGDI